MVARRQCSVVLLPVMSVQHIVCALRRNTKQTCIRSRLALCHLRFLVLGRSSAHVKDVVATNKDFAEGASKSIVDVFVRFQQLREK